MEQQQQQPVSSPLPQQTESPNKDLTNFSFTALLRQVGGDAATLKSLRNKVAKRLVDEMKATNNSLIDTFLEFSSREAPASAHNDNIVLSCTYLGNGLSLDWRAPKPQPYPVYLTVPLSYPANSPDIWFDESTPEANQACFMGAREHFLESICGSPAPVSVSTIAKTWDGCARDGLVEYARLHGGGDFFTAMGSWETA